ncbi:membrane protein insertase YidC [Fodinibius halophilus]|uniref:Membrane protein insertase YidC n=1 Tax=Fodinibius halophilus TaxID=1736908 RepID=A0A6M1T485_9BACT|nr:membrane protein insertase YidC [Fodinibius halophilus]NGP87473.1 membrane protein insertase YidC [Fodinibius halophilus]
MDRNTVTGLVLIFIVMVAWGYFSMPSEQELRERQAQARQDSIAAAQADSQRAKTMAQNEDSQQQDVEEAQASPEPQQQTLRSEQEEPQNMGAFSAASVADTSEIVVKTPLYRATFTNLGAGPSQITLKDYETWDHKPVHMIKDTTQSAYSMGFLTSENYNVETNDLVFEPLTNADSLTVAKGDSAQVRYALNISDSKRIVYTYTLSGDSHQFGLDVTFEGLERDIIGGTVDFGWTSPLNFTEKDPTLESTYSSAYVYTGGEMERLKLDEAGRNTQDYNGTIDWVATRTKFFTQIIKTPNSTQGAHLVGEQTGESGKMTTDHNYKSFITTDISPKGKAAFSLFAGPMDYHALSSYDAQTYGMVDTGYSWLSWMSDPLVTYLIIPYFDAAENYMSIGFAIILFAILIKMVLYPLTKKSYRSMAAMKELQPKMQEIKEKYEDDPEKQQKETMKLYKEEGVNPLGGCLPNLLQLPILITLWRFFQNSILIRQQEFLWAGDLSAPDYILNLPFEVPFLGDQLAGFVLLMTAAMMAQSKLTGGMGPGGGGGGAAGGPNMKALQYIFPFMLLFIFNNFAAGLSLYYLIYNVVSIGQQLIIYRQMDKEKEMANA